MLRGSLMANMMSKEDINSVIKHWISRGKSIFDDNKHLLADQDVHNELRLNLNLNIMLEAVQSILESIIADLSEVDVEACNANKILEHVGDMATEGFRLTKSKDWVDYIPTNGYSSPEYKKIEEVRNKLGDYMLDLTESKNIAQKVEIYEKKQRNISNNNEIKNYGDNCQISNNVIQSNRNSSNADIIKLIKKLVPAFILKKFGWN